MYTLPSPSYIHLTLTLTCTPYPHPHMYTLPSPSHVHLIITLTCTPYPHPHMYTLPSHVHLTLTCTPYPHPHMYTLPSPSQNAQSVNTSGSCPQILPPSQSGSQYLVHTNTTSQLILNGMNLLPFSGNLRCVGTVNGTTIFNTTASVTATTVNCSQPSNVGVAVYLLRHGNIPFPPVVYIWWWIT